MEFPHGCRLCGQRLNAADRPPPPYAAIAISTVNGVSGAPVSDEDDNCPMIDAPVCTTTETTYPNACIAQSAGETVACDNECPCDSGEGDNTFCPLIYAPVCSATNTTFENSCFALVAGDTVECDGACPCGAPSECDGTLKPVCTSAGTTYDNACEAETDGAVIACENKCPCAGELVGGWCGWCGCGRGGRHSFCRAVRSLFAARSAEEGVEDMDDIFCSAEFDPVCDELGDTYPNACFADAMNATIICAGECPCA